MKTQLRYVLLCVLVAAISVGCDNRRHDSAKLGPSKSDQDPSKFLTLEELRAKVIADSSAKQSEVRSTNRSFLVQMLSVGLTASQILSRPIAEFHVRLDPETDIALAGELLASGCGVVANQIQDADIDIELLLSTMIADKDDEVSRGVMPSSSGSKDPLRNVDFRGMLNSYRYFCKGDRSIDLGVDWSQVFAHYNEAFKHLADVSVLKRLKFTNTTTVLDTNGQPVTEIADSQGRRKFVPISQIPENVKQAFVSAEDQNFYIHRGVDIKGLIRAVSSLASGGNQRPQGGSTITQQVIKNLLLTNDISSERKMREMVLAVQLEQIMTKDQILEIYLNYVFFGRSAWGIEMAAQAYFGPQASVSNLTPSQAALLAALVKGPTFYSPDQHAERARGRREYVLLRMREDCVQQNRPSCLSAEQVVAEASSEIKTIRTDAVTASSGLYFMDAVKAEADRKLGTQLGLGSRHTVKSTIHTGLQLATEQAVQRGLVTFEENTGRAKYSGPIGSIQSQITGMTWQEALANVRSKFADVPWKVATVLSTDNSAQVGLASGETLRLKVAPSVLSQLKAYDLIYVDVIRDGKGDVAVLRSPPSVQGAAIVIENKTGRILALTGGFSYSKSNFNRALNSKRQPGSTLKPFTYLAGLAAGYQPNTLLPDRPTETRLARNWNPQNFDRTTRGLVTFRGALEHSLNLPTVQLVARLGGGVPAEGLKYVQSVWQAVGVYPETEKLPLGFSQILGSRETRLIDLSVAYATLANDGRKPTPHFIETISADDKLIVSNQPNLVQISEPVTEVSFYQLKRMLTGTLERGTAIRLRRWKDIIAGKTGTSNDQTDAWFIGFTNDITVAVWVGYDDRKTNTSLGDEQTGSRVALPIAESIFTTAFEIYKAPEKLTGPSASVQAQIIEAPINLRTGKIGSGNFVEILRLDPLTQKPVDLVNSLLQPNDVSGAFYGPMSLK